MRNIKSSITRLINTIESKLPDSNDLMGYSGINKVHIVSCLTESYNLLDELEERKETFEVIILKRKAADLIKKANKYLNDHLDSDKAIEKFDDFLNLIAEIKYSVKRTYLLVVEECIRVEAEIIKAKRELEEINNVSNDYQFIKTELENSLASIKDNIESISTFHGESKQKNDLISDYYQKSTENAETIEAYSSDAASWMTEIRNNNENIEHQSKVFDDHVKSFELLNTDLIKAEATIKTQQDSLTKQLNAAEQQQTDIQKIIEDANRASMAGSFRKRKDELDKPIQRSEILMNGVLVTIALISFFLLVDSGIGTSDFDYVSFFSRFTVIAPLIWIAWSSSRKLGHLTRIREDYAYKYASAMAYEGYRKQAEEIDADMQKRLLHISIEHMGSNPIRLFNAKNNHASPIHEVTEKLGNVFKKEPQSESALEVNDN